MKPLMSDDGMPRNSRLPTVIPRNATTLEDLPAWDRILNDAGGVLGELERDKRLIVLADSTDIAVAQAANRRPSCYLLMTREAMHSTAHARLLVRIANANYLIAGQVTIAKQSLLDVVWSTWATRAAAPARGKTGGALASSIQQTFYSMAQDAYEQGASDIHIFIANGRTEIRFRIHGDAIRQPMDMTAEDGQRLCAAIYETLTESPSVTEGFSMIRMQDASMDHAFPAYHLRFRYAGMPNEPHGYHVTLRIIPVAARQELHELTERGYAPDTAEAIHNAFSRAQGLILFCGTTGSGKSTTIANEIGYLIRERPHKIVLTVEDPVEILIPGAHQSAQSREKFAAALANLMRQDPDVLMVGEIRDRESASLAIEATRSGHLLASTLHCGGVMGVAGRLNGLGIAYEDIGTPGLISAFVFQVLVQRLCPHCCIHLNDLGGEVLPPKVIRTLRRLEGAVDKGYVHGASTMADWREQIAIRNPRGCRHCHEGIVGREACAELYQPAHDDYPLIRTGNITALWDAWRSRRSSDPADMTGRRAIEHAHWKMLHGLIDPCHLEQQFVNFGGPVE